MNFRIQWNNAWTQWQFVIIQQAWGYKPHHTGIYPHHVSEWAHFKSAFKFRFFRKILSFAGIWTHDLCGTKSMCRQLSYPGLDIYFNLLRANKLYSIQKKLSKQIYLLWIPTKVTSFDLTPNFLAIFFRVFFTL